MKFLWPLYVAWGVTFFMLVFLTFVIVFAFVQERS